jgi:hypothetical protein
MKQRDIDRWANRQARMNRQATVPAINWAVLIGIVAIVAALVIIVLKAGQVL